MVSPFSSPLRDSIRLFEEFETISPSRGELLDRWRQNFDLPHAAKSQTPRQLHVDVTLTPEQASAGGTLPIEIPVAQRCGRCDGSGSTGFFPCDQCDGHGMLWRTARVDVLLPRDVRDGTLLHAAMSHAGVRNFFLSVRVCVAPAV